MANFGPHKNSNSCLNVSRLDGGKKLHKRHLKYNFRNKTVPTSKDDQPLDAEFAEVLCARVQILLSLGQRALRTEQSAAL